MKKLTGQEIIRTYKLIPSATTFHFTDGIVDEVEGYKTSSFEPCEYPSEPGIKW